MKKVNLPLVLGIVFVCFFVGMFVFPSAAPVVFPLVIFGVTGFVFVYSFFTVFSRAKQMKNQIMNGMQNLNPPDINNDPTNPNNINGQNNFGGPQGFGGQNNFGGQQGFGGQNNFGSQQGFGGQNNFGGQQGFGGQNEQPHNESYTAFSDGVCSFCGQPLDNDAKFCESCGRKVK